MWLHILLGLQLKIFFWCQEQLLNNDFDNIKKHGTNVKIIEAQQARLCISYKNTKLKLLKANATICFNKMCKIKHMKPNYINIKINGKKSQDKKTTTNAIKYRLNQEIKFLYCKKQNLNQQPYHIHLKCAHYCNGMWQHIQYSINSRVNNFMDTLYQKLNQKLISFWFQNPTILTQSFSLQT